MYTGDNLLKYDLFPFHDMPLDTWLQIKKKKSKDHTVLLLEHL